MFYKNFKIIYLNTIDSTNNYAKNLIKLNNNIENNTVILADYQTKGRGQKGNIWISQKKKNLTFSIIIFPKLKAEDQFLLNILISLGIIDCLSNYVNNIKIKWPNDIYYYDKKMGGILIENVIKNGIIVSSIIGIGININQTLFNPQLNATSLKLITNISYNRFKILKNILDKIENRIKIIENSNKDLIINFKNEYLKNLYLFNKWHNYFFPSGESFIGKIIDIGNNGHLIIKKKDGKILEFNFKEVYFFKKDL